MSKTLANLRDRMSELLSDYHHSTVTTAIAASTSVVDTGLANVRGGAQTDYFKNWWVLFTSGANIGVARLITAYVTGTTTLTVLGGNLTTDGAVKATYELHRFDPVLKRRAINQAVRHLYPDRFKAIKDRTLVTGNWLPNAHFEDWAASTYPDEYSLTNVAAVATTTAGLYRGGAKSAKVTASAANGYLYISSDNYPRLLDLAGATVDFEAWAYPEVTSDSYLVIYTYKPDTTAQTLTSSSTNHAGEWNKIELNSQSINSGISLIEFRFKVATNAKYIYWDDARVIAGVYPHELWLPTAFKTEGVIKQINIQSSQFTSDTDPCDDIGDNVKYEPVWEHDIINDGTYKYLRMPRQHVKRRVELQGYGRLEEMTADTDTTSIDEPYVDAIACQAMVNLYQSLKEPAAMQGHTAYDEAISYYMMLVRQELARHPQSKPASRLNWRR